MKSVIIGIGSSLPRNVVTNDDLSKMVDTSDEWIRKRTGIRERRIAENNETTSLFATQAAEQSLAESGLSTDDIDLIIVGTVTPDYTFPSVATLVQRNLGIERGAAFDVSAACSGFVYALDIADSYIKLGKARNAVIIGAETFSKIIDWKDRSTCVLFGDGAGAVVLQGQENTDKGIISSRIFADGKYADYLITTGGVSFNQTAGTITMEGRDVFKQAVEKMKSAVDALLDETSYSVNDIDLLIPHQANARIISMLANQMQISDDKIVVSVDKHANTSAASIPLAMNTVKDQLSGKTILLVAMGAGFTWGASLIRI